jgi:AcrR family transcriptional regulator
MMATLEERLGLAPSERERILRATAEICAERGYRATSVAAILERADCSEESFYRKFDGVEDCTAAALGLIRSQVLAELSQASSPDLSEPESGLRAVKAILELMAANRRSPTSTTSAPVRWRRRGWASSIGPHGSCWR